MNRLHNWYCNRGAWKRHVREDLVPPPASLPGRLSDLGFREVQVTTDEGALRFSARR